jgi:hypothetical protein
VHSTNCFDIFILPSDDCAAPASLVPEKPGSIASFQHAMISKAPYGHTSDDIVLAVFADRQALPAEELEAGRDAFFSKGQPCLRSSPLVKTHGWGIHFDAQGRVALVARDDPDFPVLASGANCKVVKGMRNKRA